MRRVAIICSIILLVMTASAVYGRKRFRSLNKYEEVSLEEDANEKDGNSRRDQSERVSRNLRSKKQKKRNLETEEEEEGEELEEETGDMRVEHLFTHTRGNCNSVTGTIT